MSTPKRIQRKRTKGWRMPEGAIYVGRPTKWGNPFRVVRGTAPIGDVCSIWGHYADGRPIPDAARVAVTRFRDWVTGRLVFEMRHCHLPDDSPLHPSSATYEGTYNGRVPDWPKTVRFTAPAWDLTELTGKDLACWCPLDQPCHADVLLELANGAAA